jgi:hypothetical protein
LQPVSPEVDDQGDGSSQVKGHDQWEKAGAMFQITPAEQRRDNHSVSQAADRKKLSNSLQERKD